MLLVRIIYFAAGLCARRFQCCSSVSLFDSSHKSSSNKLINYADKEGINYAKTAGVVISYSSFLIRSIVISSLLQYTIRTSFKQSSDSIINNITIGFSSFISKLTPSISIEIVVTGNLVALSSVIGHQVIRSSVIRFL